MVVFPAGNIDVYPKLDSKFCNTTSDPSEHLCIFGSNQRITVGLCYRKIWAEIYIMGLQAGTGIHRQEIWKKLPW